MFALSWQGQELEAKAQTLALEMFCFTLFCLLLLLLQSNLLQPRQDQEKPLPKAPAKAGGPGIDPRTVTNTKAGLFVLLLFQLKTMMVV